MPATRTRPTAQQLAFAVTAGHLDATTHTGRHAAPRTCPTCRHAVLVGDDNHTAALTTTIDVTPVLRLDEAIAMARGRKTYQVRWSGGRAEISIRKSPAFMPAPDIEYAEHPEYTIHREHECRWKARIERKARAADRKASA